MWARRALNSQKRRFPGRADPQSKLLLLYAKAAFRKWEACRASGEAYAWDDGERDARKHCHSTPRSAVIG